MAKTVKTAITIPNDDFKILEILRKKTGKNRSQILVEAFEDWLNRKQVDVAEKQYAEAYKRMPETPEEIAAAQAGAKISEAAGDEDWTEDYNKWLEEHEKR